MLTHLYLSAHLDDAVLSCGALIHKQVQARERVVVATICAGDPPHGDLSSFAQELHQRWGLQVTEVVAARRAEDLNALNGLGAEAVHFSFTDCIYRTDQVGWPLYASERAIFAGVSPVEAPLVRHIADKITGLARGLGRYHLYAPLGLGHHVDHQLARRAAEASGKIYAYFEDYPYAAQRGVETQLAALTRTPDERELIGEPQTLGEAHLAAKAEAVACYASQISTFWDDRTELDAAVRAFTEKLWRIK